MRILIIADFSSIHVYNYISNVLQDTKCECIGYHIVDTTIPLHFADYYNKSNIKIVQGVHPNIYKKKGALVFTKCTMQALNKLGSFDVMHLHAVRLFVCPAIYLVRKRYKRIILTYWGSDLYRSTKLQLLKTLPLIHCSDVITMVTSDMVSYFSKLPTAISRNKMKIKVLDYGNMFYGRIESFDSARENLKEKFGLSKGKIVCTIGYVWRPQMQQYITVSALLPILKTLSDQVELALPVYGITDNDYKELDLLLRDSGIEYQLYRDFMDADMVSQFRSISDIFIHSQTTDALSCAMLEHLYAGSIVINGRWLQYSTLDDNQIYFKSFDTFSTLPGVFVDVVKNINTEKEKCISNRLKVARISSWEYLRQYWLELYK